MSPAFSSKKDVSQPVLACPNELVVDLTALSSNFSFLRSLVPNTVKIMCSVKANAYGHGLVPCAVKLQDCGADAFGVAQLQEALLLREAGISLPILVYGGILDEQIAHYINNDIQICASSIMKLSEIENCAQRFGKTAQVHLKIDTGMGRIGVQHNRVESFLEQARLCERTKIVGIFSHFASSDSEDLSFAKLQLQRFNEVCQVAKQVLGYMPLRHIANSAALMQMPDSHLDMVRPGIALYGVAPTPKFQSDNLIPALSLKSKVVYFKVLEADVGVSYNSRWRTDSQTRIITIPLGYGDGLPRSLSNKMQVLVRGKRYPQVGSICMDQLMLNLGSGEAYVGDQAVVIGNSGNEKITVAELAQLAGTIPYEILTSLNNPRLHRSYVS